MSLAVRSLVFAIVATAFTYAAQADDWPQWRGLERDGVWRETGVRTDLPSDVAVKWRAPVKLGYSGPAVAGGRVFVTDYVVESGEVTNNPGGRDELTGRERTIALDAATGRELWVRDDKVDYNLSYPGGPRTTPTVAGQFLYMLGAEGDLSCLKVTDGSVVWRKNLPQEFDAETPIWGHSASPLVVGDVVICMVGGPGAAVVALDKATGEKRWQALDSSGAGYCPPSLLKTPTGEQVVVFHPRGFAALDPATGKELWAVPMNPQYDMSIAAPVVQGDEMFVSAYGDSVLVKLAADRSSAEPVWRGTPKTSVYSSNVTPFFAADAIYGCDIEASTLVAVDPATGDRLWEASEPTTAEKRARHGTAFIVQHEPSGLYWLFSETGELVLAKLSREKYEELGRAKLVDPTNTVFGREVVWSHPAFAERAVFARNDEEIVCVDLAAE